MKKLVYLIVVISLAVSCGYGRENAYLADEDHYGFQAESVSNTRSAGMAPVENAQPEKKIIKTGQMGLDVPEIKQAKTGVDALVAKYEGYYAGERFNDSDYSSTYTLSLRIPEKNYEDFIAGLESGGGKVLYKDINARDVTEEFIDIETRLENKRGYLARYRDLLKKASSIKEIMEVEEQIRKLEEEIESAEGRLRYLGNQISYSTLDLTLSQEKNYKPLPAKSEKFWSKFKASLSGGWNIFKEIILLIFRLWPIWLIAGIVLLIVNATMKRRARKKK